MGSELSSSVRITASSVGHICQRGTTLAQSIPTQYGHWNSAVQISEKKKRIKLFAKEKISLVFMKH